MGAIFFFLTGMTARCD